MNTEGNRSRFYLIIGIIVIAGVVLSLMVGAVAGGIAGYTVANWRAQRLARAEVERWESEHPAPKSTVPQAQPTPEGRLPLLPGVPDLRGLLPFLNPDVTGAWVTQVVKGSPADKAGLQVGDLITAVNDDRVSATRTLADIIGKYKPNDEVTIHYLRGQEERTVTVRLGEHPDQRERAYLGVSTVLFFIRRPPRLQPWFNQ